MLSDQDDRTFMEERPSPDRFRWSVRTCNGNSPDCEQIASAAALLGREAYFKDDLGFECEILAAAVHSDAERLVYVESRAKEIGQFVDIHIKIHYVDPDGREQSVDIRSYNPYFGCDVGLIEWFDDRLALLIYREKHRTYVYRIGDSWPPEFRKIEDRWQIQDSILSFMGYNEATVRRMHVPSFEVLPEVSVAEAEALGQLPPDPYAG